MSGTAVTAPEVLTRARDVVGPSLRRAIDSLVGEIGSVVGYHLGWSDVSGLSIAAGSGKGIRPALALLSAEVVGAEPQVSVAGAVPIELVHNFSLIHDDVIDEDAERRHRPTVWAAFGIGRAVIVGDALLALAQQIVLDPPGLVGAKAPKHAEDAMRAARRIADATARMIAGQALDMAFETHLSVSVERCLEMEAGKTGALLGCAAAIGAVLAGADDETVNALDRFGNDLGLAFQAVDDLLGIWGDSGTTGKPTFSDLRQHKKTLPVAVAMNSRSPHALELTELLSRSELDDEVVERAASIVEECGGRAAASEHAKLRLEAALRALEGLALVPTAKDELVELANFVVERQY